MFRPENLSSLSVFETFQHELIHADIKRRLKEDYNWDGSNQSIDEAFFKLVYYEFGPNASFSEHELMLKFYIDPMVNSLIEANNNIGSEQDFIGLVYNGFDQSVLYFANVTLSQFYDLYDDYLQFISGSGIINSAFDNCN